MQVLDPELNSFGEDPELLVARAGVRVGYDVEVFNCDQAEALPLPKLVDLAIALKSSTLTRVYVVLLVLLAAGETFPQLVDSHSADALESLQKRRVTHRSVANSHLLIPHLLIIFKLPVYGAYQQANFLQSRRGQPTRELMKRASELCDLKTFGDENGNYI